MYIGIKRRKNTKKTGTDNIRVCQPIWRRMKTTFMSIDKSEEQVPATWKRKIKIKSLSDNDTTKIQSSYIN